MELGKQKQKLARSLTQSFHSFHSYMWVFCPSRHIKPRDKVICVCESPAGYGSETCGEQLRVQEISAQKNITDVHADISAGRRGALIKEQLILRLRHTHTHTRDIGHTGARPLTAGPHTTPVLETLTGKIL